MEDSPRAPVGADGPGASPPQSEHLLVSVNLSAHHPFPETDKHSQASIHTELESRPREAPGVGGRGGGRSLAMGVADVNPGALGPGSPPLSAPGDCFSVPAAATLSRV